MNIASVVVRAQPEKQRAVRSELAAIPGVQVHADCSDGRFVITIEDVPEASTADSFLMLHQIAGVVSAALVYEYSDDAFPEEPEQ